MTEIPNLQRVAEIATQCLIDEDLLEQSVQDMNSIKLLGSRAICDSLGLVSYLVTLEEHVNEAFDTSISLMSERAMSQEHSPFRNFQALVDYITQLLNE